MDTQRRGSQLLGPRNARNSIRLSDIRSSTRDSSSGALRPLPKTSQSNFSGSSSQFSAINHSSDSHMSSSRRSVSSLIHEPSTSNVSRRTSKILEGIPKAHLKPPKQLHGREEEIPKLLTAVLLPIDDCKEDENVDEENDDEYDRQ